MNRGQLGLVPLALTAAVKAKAVETFGRSIAGLFGDTATDKERKASARLALSKALDGDPDALRWLLARSGARPDGATKTAPRTAQHIFRSALRTYYATTGEQAPLDVAKALGIATTVPASGGGLTVTPMVSPATRVMPLMLVGLLGLGLFALSRRSR